MGTSSLTLDQAAERFLTDKQDKLKQSTLARYAYMLEHYILPALGVVLVCQLTANQISDFLLRLQKGGLSGKSARDVGVLLKSILRYSAKSWTAPVRVGRGAAAYRRKQIDIFYPDEIQRLAQKIMDKPTTAGIGVLLTLNTGLRLGELCALQYKDIDLRNGVIHITKTVQRIRSGDCTCLMVLPPKSDSARRTIPLPGGPGRPSEKDHPVPSKRRKLSPDWEKCADGATDNAISIPNLAESSGHPVPKFPCVAAHIRLPLRGAWGRCQEPE